MECKFLGPVVQPGILTRCQAVERSVRIGVLPGMTERPRVQIPPGPPVSGFTTPLARIAQAILGRPQSVTWKVNVVSRVVLTSTVYCPPVLNWLNAPCVP